MLVTERTSNGQVVVTLHRDWSPDRISKAYVPRGQTNIPSREAYKLQSVLLRSKK